MDAAAAAAAARAEGREEDGGCGFSESLRSSDEWLWAGPAPLDEWDGAGGGALDFVWEGLVEGDVVCGEAMRDGDGDEYPHYRYYDNEGADSAYLPAAPGAVSESPPYGDGDEYPQYQAGEEEDDSESDGGGGEEETAMADAGNPWRWTRRGVWGNAGEAPGRAWA